MQDRKAEARARELDEALLVFRLARRTCAVEGGWLRAIRQTMGIQAEELAKRLNASRREVFRLERSEKEDRIMLGTLRRAAAALECELVYALTPREGSLEEMATLYRCQRKTELERGRTKRKQAELSKKYGVNWARAMRDALLPVMKRYGFRWKGQGDLAALVRRRKRRKRWS